MTREHAYEIPSAALAAHWWVKHELPKLLARAEEVRRAQSETLATVKRAHEELTKLARDCREGVTNESH